MDFRKQFELFKIPEFFTYYLDLDRLNFFIKKFERSKSKLKGLYFMSSN